MHCMIGKESMKTIRAASEVVLMQRSMRCVLHCSALRWMLHWEAASTDCMLGGYALEGGGKGWGMPGGLCLQEKVQHLTPAPSAEHALSAVVGWTIKFYET